MLKFLRIESPRGDTLIAVNHVVAVVTSGDAAHPISVLTDAFVLSPQGPIPATFQVLVGACEDFRAQLRACEEESNTGEALTPFVVEFLEFVRGYAAKLEIPTEVPRMPADGMGWERCKQKDPVSGMQCEIDTFACPQCGLCKKHSHSADCFLGRLHAQAGAFVPRV